jgi:carbonic anhydrase/acetyltransferase-like protein (isoleucine patch superfamily)
MDNDLERSLTRAMNALTRVTHAPAVAPKADGGPSKLAQALGILAIVLIVAGITRHNHALLTLGLVLAAAGGGLFVAGNLKLATPGVKMGASVGQDAKLDETSTVEMGASVGARASLGPRSVVRMGADVRADAVLEAGAVVSWGATVGKGAVIGEGAVVGAGADVRAGARVPAGFVLHPGSTFGGSDGSKASRLKPPEPAKLDPRAARVEAVCTKLTDELRTSPGQVRDFLGNSAQTIDGLRKTCTELLRRETALRREADPGHLAEERAAIEARLERQEDAQVRDSLRGALAAIDGQQQERDQLRVAADRLDAEHTRLLYTLEQLAAQFARLRSAGDGAARAPQELHQGVVQLRGELEAIADALESVAVPPPDDALADATPESQRTRTR